LTGSIQCKSHVVKLDRHRFAPLHWKLLFWNSLSKASCESLFCAQCMQGRSRELTFEREFWKQNLQRERDVTYTVLLLWLHVGAVEHGAVVEACGTGEVSDHNLHQQDWPTHAGAEAAARRRLLQTTSHHRWSQRTHQVLHQRVGFQIYNTIFVYYAQLTECNRQTKMMIKPWLWCYIFTKNNGLWCVQQEKEFNSSKMLINVVTHYTYRPR